MGALLFSLSFGNSVCVFLGSLALGMLLSFLGSLESLEAVSMLLSSLSLSNTFSVLLSGLVLIIAMMAIMLWLMDLLMETVCLLVVLRLGIDLLVSMRNLLLIQLVRHSIFNLLVWSVNLLVGSICLLLRCLVEDYYILLMIRIVLLNMVAWLMLFDRDVFFLLDFVILWLLVGQIFV